MEEYLSGLRLQRGTLVIFDARTGLARRAPRFEEATTRGGHRVTVLWA